ncbi:zinc finger, C2H2 type [Ancylostoma ceylanicum]|uniref:Zinc finger, C2H2 type n=1 Tax=Ancylostoma ceylanicum TaxID=53326 RepID=A0A0D6LLE8_9BILA|nr:zinc finger, C2H2 type [Ancylostoma ceylanicum]
MPASHQRTETPPKCDGNENVMPRSAPTTVARPPKRSSKPQVRRRELASIRSKAKGTTTPPQSSFLTEMVQAPPQSSSHSLLVSEAIALAVSKGLRGGYIEFLRSNTDESIKRSFDEVKKELTNRQSFLKSATSVVRYLQAARILYNRLDWKKRRKYEYAARERARAEHASQLKEKGVDDDMPLFVNESSADRNACEETLSKNACHMPPSEYLFKDKKSLQDFKRYEAFKSRKIYCPLCPTTASDRLTSAVHYQFHMNFATLIMVCTDCGSQLLVRSSFIGESSISHWSEIINFHTQLMFPQMLHNAEKVVPLIVYSQEDFTPKLRLRIQAMTPVVKGVRTDCPHCGKCDFDTVEALESHFLSHEESPKKCCSECGMQFSQEGFYREHLLSHLGTKACYLAVHLSRICTFITQHVDACESVTVKKKVNRRGRKRKAGPAYKKDPDEVEDDPLPTDETALKLRRLLGDSFDPENVLRVNSFCYTAINSKDESEESSAPYNLHSAEFHCLVEDSLSGPGTKVLMCRRCHCLCLGVKTVQAHLARCCPELQCDENNSVPYDLENGLLVFCVYAGKGVPNTRISCWECSSTVCSVLGLRIHMVVDHGIFMRVEEDMSASTELMTGLPPFFTATTRAINKEIGLTENGSLPVNLEERRKEALLKKIRSNQTVSADGTPQFRPPSSTSSIASTTKVQTSNANAPHSARVSSPPLVLLDEAPPPSVQILDYMDYMEPHSVQILDGQKRLSPVNVSSRPTEVTIDENNAENKKRSLDSTNALDNGGISGVEDIQVFEVSGISADVYNQGDPCNATTTEVTHVGDPEGNNECVLLVRPTLFLAGHA